MPCLGSPLRGWHQPEDNGGLGRAREGGVSTSGRPAAPLLPAQVLTAQQLPKLNAEKPNSIVDPLVRIEIHGVPADCARKETNYVLNNGAWGPCCRGGVGRGGVEGGPQRMEGGAGS